MQQRTRPLPRSRRDAPAFRPGWLRFVLALCASFVAAGYFAAISHMTFVVHAWCAEHGSLVHADTDARDHAQVHGERPATTSLTAGGAPSSDEHEHCVLGLAQPGEGRVPQAGHRLVPHEDPPEPLDPVPAQPPARTPVPPPPPIALLLLSPKSSPPA